MEWRKKFASEIISAMGETLLEGKDRGGGTLGFSICFTGKKKAGEQNWFGDPFQD